MSEGRPGLEAGMVGFEGRVGANLVLGVRTANLRAVVQGAGVHFASVPPH